VITQYKLFAKKKLVISGPWLFDYYNYCDDFDLSLLIKEGRDFSLLLRLRSGQGSKQGFLALVRNDEQVDSL
jgi:hypothetical protein